MVTGGIAAYKSAFLVRLLSRGGAEVRVAMTASAARFVAPLTFEVLSGHSVPVDMFAPRVEPVVQHVELAKWAERVVVAPATADFLAKMAHGLADDLASATVLAAGAPVLVAPAMNERMWAAAATRRNVAALAADGVAVLDPCAGDLACGDAGPGRMMEPEDILRAVERSFVPGDLAGVRVLVTAGRTEEEIDPVRYLSNRSSGRMGFALARAARERGARVTLVHGPVDVPPPPVDEIVRVTSAAEMKRAVARAFRRCDLCLMAAAVSDFAPARRAATKLKRAGAGLSIELRPTEDILASLGASKAKGQIVVGFALETTNAEANAVAKGRAKRCDYIVLNEPGPGTGFGAETNRVTMFRGAEKLFSTPVVTKEEAARRIVDVAAGDRRLRRAGRPS